MCEVACFPIQAPPADALTVQHEVLGHPEDGKRHAPQLGSPELPAQLSSCVRNVRLLLFYDIEAECQLKHGSDVMYEMRRRKAQPTLFCLKGSLTSHTI